MRQEQFYNALCVTLCGDYKKLETLKSRHAQWETAWLECEAKLNARIDPGSEWRKLEGLEIKLVLRDAPEYPTLLREIPQPPFGIYVLGSLPPETTRTVAIVGTRKATAEGKEFAKKFAFELARHGFAIASGLALGIDAAAHEGCLEAKGKTVAVLGNGLNYFYPRTNERLANRILAEGGAVISEYPVGTEPLPYRFLERNRIVSGLSEGIIVIEAPNNSGSLVTAKYAVDQNRQVFVLPGPATHPNYVGSHSLIRHGAELVTKPEDILLAFNMETSSEKTQLAELETPEEKSVFEALKNSAKPLGIDKIVETTKLSASEVNKTVTYLIIKNIVRETSDGCYTIQ